MKAKHFPEHLIIDRPRIIVVIDLVIGIALAPIRLGLVDRAEIQICTDI